MRGAAFLCLLGLLVALGCASVAREESTRLYGPNDAEVNAAYEYMDRGGLSALDYADSVAMAEYRDAKYGK